MSIMGIVLALALVFAIVFTLFASSMANSIIFRIAGLALPIVVMILDRFTTMGWLFTAVAIIVEVGICIYVFMNRLI